MCTARFSSSAGGSAQPPGCRPSWRQTPPWSQTARDAGHVTCDACWEANPHPPVDRQTPVKTLPYPKLHLWAVQLNPIILTST